MKIKLFTLLLLLPLAAFSAPRDVRVKGYVYEDANRNSVFDKTEKGLEGIAVSNGREVVLTDKKGRYELPVRGNCEIFVIKPSGYSVPAGKYGLPAHYYLHRPQGSPQGTKYAGIAPTDDLPKELNFPLYAAQEPEDFRIVVFGDPQSRDRRDAGFLGQEVVKPLLDSASAYRFGLVLGDVSFNDLDVFEPVMQRIGLIGIPWYVLPGNHDHNQDKHIEDDSLGTETYMDFFGPATYSFNYGKVHFIMTDDIVLPNPTGKTQYIGGLTEKQLAFIENDLKYVPEDYLIVFAGHIQLFDSSPNAETFRSADRKRLFGMLSRFPHTVSLSAHTHYIRQFFFDRSNGWDGDEPHLHLNAGATCADWYKGLPDPYGFPNAMMRDGSPQGYFTFDFRGNDYTFAYHASRQADFRDMSLYIGDSLKTGEIRPIYANFYNGNELSELSCRIDGGQWMKMEQTVQADPTFAALSALWNDKAYKLPGRKVSNPVKSYHLWKAPLPAFDAPGVHIAEVQARDMFGRVYTEKLVFEVL